jgi:chitinase
MTDTGADADVLFNSTGGHYISLDTPRTTKLKGEYVLENKLGGIFSWSGDQDNGLLANAAREGTGYEALREKIDMGPLYNKGEKFELGGES